ncbi:hypothetical protein HDU96_005817 [Phlyctochytrium bullatum]|nr:hypothetical protein HDU96_005817 [Phlyctochytrium bullatum]
MRLSRKDTELLVWNCIKSDFPTAKGLSPELANDVFEKSQGNPMVVCILSRLLADSSPDIDPESRLLGGASRNSSLLPLDVSSAVISQFDRLPNDVKSFLRVAAISGQFFSLGSVQHVLSVIYENGSERFSDGRLMEALRDAIKAGLIATSQSAPETYDPVEVFTFVHYLVYQGILQSIVPSRKEEINQTYADYYENRLSLLKQQSSQSLSALVRHLMEVRGNEERKVKYVRQAFILFAEQHRYEKGFYYYEMLQDIRKNDPDPIDKVKELRCQALLFLEVEKPHSAYESICLAFKIVGIPFGRGSKNMLQKLVRFLKTLRFCIRSCKLPPDVRYAKCADFMQRLMPKVITRAAAANVEFLSIASEEVLELCRTAFFCFFNHFEDDLQIPILSCLSYVATVTVHDQGYARICGANVVLGIMASSVEDFKTTKHLLRTYYPHLHNAVNSRDLDNPLEWMRTFSATAILTEFWGAWEHAAMFGKRFLEIRKELEIHSISQTHQFRINRICCLDLLGRVREAVKDLTSDLEEIYSLHEATFEAFEVKLYLAMLSFAMDKKTLVGNLFDEYFRRVASLPAALVSRLLLSALPILLDFTIFLRGNPFLYHRLQQQQKLSSRSIPYTVEPRRHSHSSSPHATVYASHGLHVRNDPRFNKCMQQILRVVANKMDSISGKSSRAHPGDGLVIRMVSDAMRCVLRGKHAQALTILCRIFRESADTAVGNGERTPSRTEASNRRVVPVASEETDGDTAAMNYREWWETSKNAPKFRIPDALRWRIAARAAVLAGRLDGKEREQFRANHSGSGTTLAIQGEDVAGRSSGLGFRVEDVAAKLVEFGLVVEARFMKEALRRT